jgi:acyl-CoA synthetase (AMP-forming)/AMP-acid ligase II
LRVPSGPILPPPIVFRGRRWSREELVILAGAWRDALEGERRAARSPAALVMANHPEAVALFFAVSCFPAPLIVLPADPRAWRTVPPLPAGTPLVLPPALRGLASRAEQVGLSPISLDQPGASGPPRAAPFMSLPGLVMFTSGSTGLPRPVYRTASQVIRSGAAIATAFPFQPPGGVIGTLPLDRSFGLHHCVLAPALGGRPLALLERFHHAAVLDLFASEDYSYWAGTPVMADALARCACREPHPAPPICVISGRLSAPVRQGFRARFGVPLRQVYGTTETGSLTLDMAPMGEVRSDTAGQPLPDVMVRIGESPAAPRPPGESGRIWVRTPRLMAGYGFPPGLEEPETTNDGWWATPDMGQWDATGSLKVEGRLDDCLRTAAGHLVSPAAVADALEGVTGVTDVAVVPIGEPHRPELGVLVETRSPVGAATLRHHLARSLPPWAQPRVVEVMSALPRLESGRTDRLACIAILERARCGTGLR